MANDRKMEIQRDIHEINMELYDLKNFESANPYVIRTIYNRILCLKDDLQKLRKEHLDLI